jgi:hypothetical protein
METVKKKLEELAKLRVQAKELADFIKKDKDLTSEARRRKLQELRQTTNEKVSSIRKEYHEAVAELQENLQKDAFGYHAHWAGEKPGEWERYTNLLNEVSGKTREALEKILQNAKLSGDTLATKAVLKEGYERGWTQIVEACLNVNPSLRESYQKVDEFDKMFGDRRSVEVKFAERVVLSGVDF